MSIWDTLKTHAKAQFLDVIQWMEDDQQTLVYRFPVFNQAIQDGGKLVVREGQAGLFQNEGRISEVFGPGTHEISTRTKAILSFFESIKYQLNYPYKGDVFFVSTRQFIDQKWGTPTPIMVDDDMFGMVEVRAFGSFNFRVTDPAKFLRELVGNRGMYETKEIAAQLKNELVTYFADSLGETEFKSVTKLASQYVDLGEAVQARLSQIFENLYGVALTRFTVASINLPEEVRAAIRDAGSRRATMKMLGEDYDKYQKDKMIDVMHAAASRPGGGSNPMMDAGMGLAMGQMMGGMVGSMAGGQQQQGNPHQAPPMAPPPPPVATLHYSGPAGQGQHSPQEIAQKIAANRSGNHNIWAPGWPSWRHWSQVPEVATLVPPEAAPPPIAGSTFHYHGPSGQGQLSATDVAGKLKADPGGRHLVWKEGWSGWQPAQDVPEIQAAMNSGPPPVPPSGGPPPPPM